MALFAIINILMVFFWAFLNGHEDDIVIFYLSILTVTYPTNSSQTKDIAQKTISEKGNEINC